MSIDQWLSQKKPSQMASLMSIYKPRCPNSRPHTVFTCGGYKRTFKSIKYKGY